MAFPPGLDWRLLAPWVGTVIDNKDPEGLHRVLVRIPGLMDESSWACPMTSGGGSPQFGGHIVPPVGSDVIVQFIGGDYEYPVYSSGHWGRKEPPITVRDAGDQAHLVQALQLGNLLFTYDDRPRSGEEEQAIGQQFTITDLKANKVILTYDLERQGWDIQADYMIRLKSTGFLILEGLQAQVQGRLVKRGTSKKI